MITQDELKQLLSYDSVSGLFTWIKPQKGIKVGAIAGNLSSSGYARIRINGKSYQTHRLVYLYVYGFIPTQDVDHINGNRSDNRACNLRLATRSENNQNRNMPNRNNKVGHKGIWQHESG